MYLTGLARVAREAGLTVREVPGWKNRTAHRGGMTKVVGVIWHHTATPAASVLSKNNPTTQYMVDGLGYPLTNYGLAWDGSADVIAAGTGAHAGKGAYKGVPNNDGNRHMIGVEVEGTIGLTWSPAQLEAAARLGAQLNRDFGTQLLHIGHYEWAPGRKTDPTGIPGGMPALRAAIARGYWAQPIIVQSAGKTNTTTNTKPTMEDTMSKLDNEDIQNIKAAIREVLQEVKVVPDNRKADAFRIGPDGRQEVVTKTRYEQGVDQKLTKILQNQGVPAEQIADIHAAIVPGEGA